MRAIFANLALFITLARGETQFAFAGAPGLAWRSLIMAGWALTAIVLGALVGLMAVILPPTAVFAVVMLAAIVMLWALPDFPSAPDTLIRRMLIVALIVNLLIPTFYTVQVAALPWISARRLVTFPLIVLFAIAVSTSRDGRRRIANVIGSNRWIAIFIFGYPAAAFLSIFTSISPLGSLGALGDAFLEVYSLFLLFLYVIKSDKDVEFIIRLILWSALFLSLVAPFDTLFHAHVYLLILPKSFVNNLIANNPSFAALLTEHARAGLYRAAASFSNALSFGEFEAMMAPLAAVFFLNGRTWKDRLFGGIVAVACLLGIFFSGSRGGYVAAIAGLVAVAAIWVLRSYRQNIRSMKPAVAGAFVAVGVVAVVLAVLFVPAVHNRVIGGGADQASTDSRRI